jgi:uncharacterized protein
MEINPIIKEVTTDCNLRCKYCFFAKQERRRNRVSTAMLRTIVGKICECNPDNQEIIFYWHGGEPLLAGIDFYNQAVEFQQRFKKSGQKIRNAIETNATLLNSEWADFLSKKGFETGVSLDGPRKYHNEYRRYPDGRGSFDDVMKGVEVLKNNGIEFRVLAVVNKKSVLAPEEIFKFFSLNEISNSVNLAPALGIETGHGLSFECSVEPVSYIDFLIKIFDFWMKTDKSELKILPLESIVRAFLGFSQEDCRFAGECRKSIVVEYNGDIFACNTYGYGDFFKFGNIKNGVEAILDPQKSSKYKNYLDFLRKIKTGCFKCKWYRICKGGCPGWYYLGGGKNILCQDFKRLFRYIQRNLERYQLI